MIVAIDGPAGAGKSTVADRVARELGFQLIDTGALYRVVAAEALDRDLAPDEAEAVAGVARELEVDFEREEGENVLVCDGERVGREIRTPEVSRVTSVISSHPEVREALLEVQRRLGRRRSSVLEGRDIGTVVFPDADVKIFLTATPEERARRRLEELDSGATYEEVLDEIRSRDRRDRNRDVAPLARADDAVEIDSTDRSIGEVVEAILSVVGEEGGEPVDGDGA